MSGALRFFAGGGEPPRSHEVLLVEPGGGAWYLTGMPWPEQPPFDEIGAYRADLGPAAYERLAGLAQAVVAGPEAQEGHADAGSESVRLEDGATASWGARRRARPAQALVAAAREAITAARAHPYAVARAVVAGDRVRVANRGAHGLVLSDGRAFPGWGRPGSPPSPHDFGQADAAPLDLPPTLEPGAVVEAALPAMRPPDRAAMRVRYALVSLRWVPPPVGEGQSLKGWLVAGPA